MEQLRNTWKKELQKQMRAEGFKCGWRKKDKAAKDTAEWRREVSAALAASRHN